MIAVAGTKLPSAPAMVKPLRSPSFAMRPLPICVKLRTARLPSTFIERIHRAGVGDFLAVGDGAGGQGQAGAHRFLLRGMDVGLVANVSDDRHGGARDLLPAQQLRLADLGRHPLVRRDLHEEEREIRLAPTPAASSGSSPGTASGTRRRGLHWTRPDTRWPPRSRRAARAQSWRCRGRRAGPSLARVRRGARRRGRLLARGFRLGHRLPCASRAPAGAARRRPRDRTSSHCSAYRSRICFSSGSRFERRAGGPGLRGRAAHRGMDQPHRHLQRPAQIATEEPGDGGELRGGFRARIPSKLPGASVFGRVRRAARHGEQPELGVAGGGDGFVGVGGARQVERPCSTGRCTARLRPPARW